MVTATGPETFIWPVRIYYDDTDAYGHVYHSNYLNYFSHARIEWFRHLGMDLGALREEQNIVFPVCKADLRFVAPAKFDDVLEIVSRVHKAGRASIVYHQIARLQAKPEQICCDGIVKIACTTNALKPAPLPTQLCEIMSNFVR